MSILWVFETDVFVVQKGLFAIEDVKNRFSLFIFTIYDMGIQENVFYNILERKNVLLGYKNEKFKKSKN